MSLQQQADDSDQEVSMPAFQTELSKRLWQQIQGYKTEFHHTIKDMDASLTAVLRNHEYEFNQAYNFFVKHKEKEIKLLIDQITVRLSDQAAADKKMQRLLLQNQQLREQTEFDSKLVQELQSKVQNLTAELSQEKQERIFYHDTANVSIKRRNLLKVVLSRLQAENNELKSKYAIADADYGKTSKLHEEVQSYTADDQDIDKRNILQQQSLLSISSQGAAGAPPQSQGKVSSDNLRLESFVDQLLLQPAEQSKVHLAKYVSKIETTFQERINQLQTKVDKMKKQLSLERAKQMEIRNEKNDLEELFIQCVQDTRKEVVRRRMRMEIAHKKVQPINPYHTVSSDHIDSTLVKLADLQKGRAKLDEFTCQDRLAVMELFVNTESVLMKVHDAVFGGHTTQLQKTAKMPTHSELKVQSMLTHDSSLKEFMARPSNFLLGHSGGKVASRNADLSVTTVQQATINKQRRHSLRPVMLKTNITGLPEIKTPSNKQFFSDQFN